MAKIRKRSKDGHEVGNFGVGVAGKWVNLGTKDAKVARKRASLALAGRWPLPEAAEGAAEVAARAEHVPAVEPETLPQEQAPIGARSEGAPAAMPPAVGAPIVEPPPEDVDPVAAARAAAAEVAGDAELPGALPAPPVDLAREMGKELQREFFPESGGDDGSDPGLVGASILFSIEHELFQKIASRAKPPRFIPEPANTDVLVRVTACACRVLGRNWTGDISIHPLYVLLAVALVGYPVQMAFAARTEEQLKAAAAAEKAPEGN